MAARLAIVEGARATPDPDWHDPKWIAGLRAGDERIFEELIRLLSPALCAYADRFVGADAEDLVHNVFVNLWMKRSTFVVRDSVRTYLFRAVTNRCINARRDRVTERTALARVLHWREANETELSEPELALQRSQLARAVRAAIDRLPERIRTAFDLVRTRGMSYGEAAAVMGVSVKTIDTHLTRAAKALRESLRGVWP